MTKFNRVATLALGLLTIASSAPALAKPNGARISASRAAAIRACNGAAATYRQYPWGRLRDRRVPLLHDPGRPAGVMHRVCQWRDRIASPMVAYRHWRKRWPSVK